MDNLVEVTILGHNLRLKCKPESKQLLIDGAKELENTINQIAQKNRYVGIDKSILILALNQHFELEKARITNQKQQQLIEKMKNMDSKLESFLQTHKK